MIQLEKLDVYCLKVLVLYIAGETHSRTQKTIHGAYLYLSNRFVKIQGEIDVMKVLSKIPN